MELEMDLLLSIILFRKDSSYKCQLFTEVCAPSYKFKLKLTDLKDSYLKSTEKLVKDERM